MASASPTPSDPAPAYSVPMHPPDQRASTYNASQMPAPKPGFAPVYQQPVMTGPPGNWHPAQGQMQVPGQFEMNAEETGRVIRHVTVQQNVYPLGARVLYPEKPTTITCQYCHKKVVTEVASDFNVCTIFRMIVVFFLCWPIGVCLLWCWNFESHRHICPNCRKEVGIA